jgi:hypothetical protein
MAIVLGSSYQGFPLGQETWRWNKSTTDEKRKEKKGRERERGKRVSHLCMSWTRRHTVADFHFGFVSMSLFWRPCTRCDDGGGLHELKKVLCLSRCG